MPRPEDLVASYYPLLLEGDAAPLLGAFSGEPVVHDPRLGEMRGAANVTYLVQAARDWLRQREAQIEQVATTATPERVAVELVLHLEQEGVPIALPVAVVGDSAGERLTSIRIYHSNWPLIGRHLLRRPILPANPGLRLLDSVARYHSALGEGDLDEIVAQLEPDGYAREPSGGPYVYRGRQRLREFYGMLFSNGGGIVLQHCTATDDGIRCALEYNAVRWGRTRLPRQAGVAVYERAPSGLLAAARIYDDVDPPLAR